MSLPRAQPASASQHLGHRTDIQVLRGVAVLLVLAFHAAVPGFSAGFVGVDVFFVVSGYLITRLLVAEHARSGHIDMVDFFVRRARRLLPAAALVGIVTAAGWFAVASSVERARQSGFAIGAALFHANIALADAGRSYLGTGDAEVPWEHWWSLGVEEQFYLLWPLALLGLLSIRRLRSTGVMATIAMLAVGSLVYGARATIDDPAGAYFLLSSRAWQLLFGGLLALVELRGLRPDQTTRRALLGAGTAGMLATLVVVSDQAAYPGMVALLPTTATVALLAAGIGTGRPHARGPQQPVVRGLAWVGDRSYSLYLWHWPALVLLARVRGGASAQVEDLQALARAAAVVASLVLAHLTYRGLENPFRQSSWLRAHRGATVVTGAALVICFAGVVALATTTHGPPPADGQLPPDVLLEQQLPPPTSDVSALRPPLAAASKDLPTPRRCLSVNADPDPAPLSECRLGVDRGGQPFIAWGDSHIDMWQSALDAWALRTGRHGFLLWKSACSPFDIPPIGLNGEHFESCARWRETARSWLRDIDSDLLVVAGATTGTSFPVSDEEWARAIPAGIDQLHELVPDARIVLLGDVPVLPDVPLCVEEFGTDAARCQGEVHELIRDVERRTAEQREHVRYLDTTRWLCRTTCPVVMGDVLVYRDDNHVTDTFAAAFAAVLVEVIP